MRRRLFTFAAAVSAVMCVAACVMWVRSHWVRDIAGRFTNFHYIQFDSSDGMAVVRVTSFRQAVRRSPREFRLSHAAGPAGELKPLQAPASSLNRLGFQFSEFRRPTMGYHMRELIFPWWSIALSAIVLPALYGAARRRNAAGLCPSCGYDLRVAPDRCPECGAVPKPAKGAA